MGKVGISLKIMPASAEVSLDSILEKIKAKYHVEDAQQKPFAFGLKSLDILILTEDKGGTDAIEDFINSIDGVNSLDIVSVSVI
jgi:translation elongation factor aEF-1 beta